MCTRRRGVKDVVRREGGAGFNQLAIRERIKRSRSSCGAFTTPRLQRDHRYTACFHRCIAGDRDLSDHFGGSRRRNSEWLLAQAGIINMGVDETWVCDLLPTAAEPEGSSVWEDNRTNSK
jgi:hypothetical protein